MKQLASLSLLLLSLLLSACGSDEFQGRFTDAEGLTSYEFGTDGSVWIVSEEQETMTGYQYDASRQSIRLSGTDSFAAQTFKVNEDGNLKAENTVLSRAVDISMLDDSTWIGHQGPYTFALTFSQTDKGLETYSELVTYYEDDMTYLYQTDDSITKLKGNLLMLDMTRYTVSEVKDDSMKLTIGDNNMVIHKHPKDTAIDFREGYSNIDDE